MIKETKEMTGLLDAVSLVVEGSEVELDELSTEKLGEYKKAAGAQAKELDSRGEYKKASKRLSGIIKATVKQFDNDLKKYKSKSPVVEDVELDEAVELEEKIDMTKADMGDVIKDFQQSDAPQFVGKSKEKRRAMAIAAKMQADRLQKEEKDMLTYRQFVEQLLEYTPSPGGRTIVRGRSYGAQYHDPEGDAEGDETVHKPKPVQQEPEVKRGRGRPSGSYGGAYKARSAETKAAAAAKSATTKSANRALRKEDLDLDDDLSEARGYGHFSDKDSFKRQEMEYELRNERPNRSYYYKKRPANSQPSLPVKPTPQKEDYSLDEATITDRLALASDPNISHNKLDRLIKDKNFQVRASVAKHPNLSAEHLDVLSGDKDAFVRASVAKNPNLSAEHLDGLCGDKDTIVRTAVAKHPNLSAEHLDVLSGDKDTIVRTAVAKHPNLSIDQFAKINRLGAKSRRQNAERTSVFIPTVARKMAGRV